MNRTQLIERASKRTLARYGQELPGSLFDDLIDNGLIPKGERRGNDGKHPIYEFSRASYRRALQIIRLRSMEIVGRDAVRVQFFLRQYSQPVWDVREALCNEYAAVAKSLSNQIRSGYADNWRPIPTKHKKSFLHQSGEL